MRGVTFLWYFYLVIATATTSSAQIFTRLVDFDGPNGSSPTAALIEGADGNFYGTTYSGGYGDDPGAGTVFKMTPDGALTPLYYFCAQSDCSDGMAPSGPLLQATDGNFYGTTQSGGTNGLGTVFKVTAEGVLTTLHSFDFTDGAYPAAGLVQATDGDLYGTTPFGGRFDLGTVFKITLGGMLSTVHSFEMTDGAQPYAGVVAAKDGNFYGTTSVGPDQGCLGSGCGTVFKVTPGGALTTLYKFCSQSSCADGFDPESGLLQARDGNLYGTTSFGGTAFRGSIFKITTEGVLTTLYSFSGADGARPEGVLVQAGDGSFYGTTQYGGPNQDCFGGCGTIYTISPEGVLTTVHSFDVTDGANPAAGLALSGTHDFYGTTAGFGTYQYGTIFRLVTGILSITKSGMGTVIGGNGHIYCGDMCSYSYDAGTQLTLTAIPASGYTFTDWNGCDDTDGSYCWVTMTTAKNVTAAFGAAQINLTSLFLMPTYVRGGQLSAGTITLSGPAPAGGLGIALSSDHPGVAHPPSFVIVPANKTTVQFAVKTFPVKSDTKVKIAATANGLQVSGNLMVGTSSYPKSLR